MATKVDCIFFMGLCELCISFGTSFSFFVVYFYRSTKYMHQIIQIIIENFFPQSTLRDFSLAGLLKWTPPIDGTFLILCHLIVRII